MSWQPASTKREHSDWSSVALGISEEAGLTPSVPAKVGE
jgi:hypothetical protein